MSPLAAKPFRIKACLGKKSFSTFLGFQLILSFFGCPVIGMLFAENESPRPIPLAPALESPRVVLLFSARWILAKSNVEAVTGRTPEHINKIGLFGNSRHEVQEGWLRGVDLNHRPLGYEPSNSLMLKDLQNNLAQRMAAK